MKVRDASATIFSRVSAPPPPLISSKPPRRLVRAVDVDFELAGRVQVEDGDAVRLEPLRARFRARHGPRDPIADRRQSLDEEVDGRARADADTAPSRTNSSAACAARCFFEFLAHVATPGNNCARFRGHSLRFGSGVPIFPFGGAVTSLLRCVLLLLGGLLLASFLLGRLLCLSCHINLHVGLVRAQYLQKSNSIARGTSRISALRSRHTRASRDRALRRSMRRSRLFEIKTLSHASVSMNSHSRSSPA